MEDMRIAKGFMARVSKVKDGILAAGGGKKMDVGLEDDGDDGLDGVWLRVVRAGQ